MGSRSCRSHNSYFSNINSLLSLSILISTLILTGFSTNVFGQVAFPLPQLEVIHKAHGQRIIGVEAVGNQLFVATTEGVWLIKKDNQPPFKVVNGEMTDIEVLGDQLFVGTEEGLWLINKNDQQPIKVVSGPSVVDRFDDADDFPLVRRDRIWGLEGIGGVQKQHIIKLEVVGKRLFAITPKGLWIISRDGTQATKVDRIRGNLLVGNVNEWVSISEVISERLFIPNLTATAPPTVSSTR